METSTLETIWQASLSWWKSGTEKRPKIPPELLTESVCKPLSVNGNRITVYRTPITETSRLSRTAPTLRENDNHGYAWRNTLSVRVSGHKMARNLGGTAKHIRLRPNRDEGVFILEIGD